MVHNITSRRVQLILCKQNRYFAPEEVEQDLHALGGGIAIHQPDQAFKYAFVWAHAIVFGKSCGGFRKLHHAIPLSALHVIDERLAYQRWVAARHDEVDEAEGAEQEPPLALRANE